MIVGRASEKATFESALQAKELPFHLFYIYGPGGVGKTTLLSEFLQISAQSHSPAYYIDARNVEPSPDALISAIQHAMGIEPTEAPFAQLATQARHPVLLIDTYETLAPLDD
jgi:predicted AAA+ superfamily ATPase